MKYSFWIVSNMSEIINLNVGLFGVLGRDDRARERWNMIKNAHNNSIMTAEHTHSNSLYQTFFRIRVVEYCRQFRAAAKAGTGLRPEYMDFAKII